MMICMATNDTGSRGQTAELVSARSHRAVDTFDDLNQS